MRKILFKHKWWMILGIISIIMASAVDTAKAFVLQYIIDNTSSLNINKLFYLAFIVIIYLISLILVTIFESACCNTYVRKCMISLKYELFNNIIALDMQEFYDSDSSEYISTLSNDMNMIEADFFQTSIQVFEYIVSFIFAFIAIFNIHYYFILFIIVTAWMPIIINGIMSKTITKRKLDLSEGMSTFLSKIRDIFTGFETIRIFNIQKAIKNNFMKSNTCLEEKRFKSKFINDVCEYLSFISSLFIWLGSLLLGCFLVMKQILTIGYVLSVTQLLNNITNPLYRLSFLLNKLKASNELLNSKMKRTKIRSDWKHCNTTPESICFSNVNFKINNKHILKNINITFERGKKYVIIGESGSGKSTLIKLLMRYYNNYDGNIRIDGTELTSIDIDEWYYYVSLIQQNVYIFNDTIKNNIVLFREYGTQEFNDALVKSNISSLIASLSEKEMSIINENGKNLSGGECQRISIARAFIRKTPILLLDEATSALDIKTSLEIEKTILDMENVTVIAVTHKINPELMLKYDRVIEIRNGEIINDAPYVINS